MTWQLPIGATPTVDGVDFLVWASDRKTVAVAMIDEAGKEQGRYPLQRSDDGYFKGHIAEIGAGSRYMYALDGETLRPDPASRSQPTSVHEASAVVDPRFGWTDEGWQGITLEDAVIYEVHIGTATEEGTFEGFIARLPYLKELGVTAIEILPVADFPGDRNWGYDGVSLFAPARAYGGAVGLKRLVDAAHGLGLAVIQDVVYNHFGPDGNYLRDFSRHYFDPEIRTPWGDGLNFAERPVRDFFINNALYWAHEYHMDGLRLDATHAIIDKSSLHILTEIGQTVRTSLPIGRHFLITAEDERNKADLIKPVADGGFGLDALWADEFHHEVRSSLAGDNEGYYADFSGSAEDLAATIRRGWFYTGQNAVATGKRRGSDASTFDPPHFIYCIQNHDQIGNRPLGNRLTADIEPDAYRAASALLLLSPYTPLLFQGQEWAASTPFLYFTDHNEELGKAITEGRRKEFKAFTGFAGQQVPDPQAEATFTASKLRWAEAEDDDHRPTRDLYRALLQLRHTLPALRDRRRANWTSEPVGDADSIALRYSNPAGNADMLLLVNLKDELDIDLAAAAITAPPAGRHWQIALNTDDPRFGGSGKSAALHTTSRAGRFSATTPAAVALTLAPR